jgi:hypothetical protein
MTKQLAYSQIVSTDPFDEWFNETHSGTDDEIPDFDVMDDEEE